MRRIGTFYRFVSGRRNLGEPLPKNPHQRLKQPQERVWGVSRERLGCTSKNRKDKSGRCHPLALGDPITLRGGRDSWRALLVGPRCASTKVGLKSNATTFRKLFGRSFFCFFLFDRCRTRAKSAHVLKGFAQLFCVGFVLSSRETFSKSPPCHPQDCGPRIYFGSVFKST